MFVFFLRLEQDTHLDGNNYILHVLSFIKVKTIKLFSIYGPKLLIHSTSDIKSWLLPLYPSFQSHSSFPFLPTFHNHFLSAFLVINTGKTSAFDTVSHIYRGWIEEMMALRDLNTQLVPSRNHG